MDKFQEAARNIRFALESVGVDPDIALHRGFQLVADFAHLSFLPGDDFYLAYSEATRIAFNPNETE